ncbi:MAG TPA: hypothetical protein VGB50_05650 [Flavobacterium sp.]|jgi:hypothetical protein
MPRFHLFEFEDQEWFPGALRNYLTDFLQFLSNSAKLYKPVIPVIQKGIKCSGSNRIVDLASGGGGGLLWLNKELQKGIPGLRILLTDFYPNIDAFEFIKQKSSTFEFVGEPVDARDVPKTLTGLRTQFLSFHHFRPEDARKILQNAVNSKNPIAIFEAQERSLPSFVAMLLSPLTVWLATPFIRPFSVGRLLFTYLIPIVPLFVMWDGFVSCLRTYSIKEMNALVDSLHDKETFDWDISKVPSGPTFVLYLLGTPKIKNPGSSGI